jgi:hypothetical protein
MNVAQWLAKIVEEKHKHCCYNGGKKHNYKSIWERHPSGFKAREWEGTVAQFESLAFTEVYMGEVCRWCGDIIHRDELKEKT